MKTPLSQAASILGKKSAEKQYGHMTKKEKSEVFKKKRALYTKKQKEARDKTETV